MSQLGNDPIRNSRMEILNRVQSMGQAMGKFWTALQDDKKGNALHDFAVAQGHMKAIQKELVKLGYITKL